MKVIQIGKAYYEYVPITFSVSAFFQSLEGAIKVAAEAEKAKKAAEKAAEKRTKKAAERSSKRIENRAKKVAAKAKELQKEFSNLPESVILQLAEKFVPAA